MTNICKKICLLTFLFFCFLIALSREARAYPDEEKAVLTLSEVTSQAAEMYLSSDNRYLYLGFNDRVRIVDMAKFALASTQPYDFGSDEDYDGIVGGVVLSTSKLYVTQEEGYLLTFKLSDVAAEPTSKLISSSSVLGNVVINSSGTKLYILDTTNDNVLVYTIGAATVSTIQLATNLVSDFDVNNILLVSEAVNGQDYIYVTTNVGIIFYIVDGNTTASAARVADLTDNLTSMASRSNIDALYVINTSDKKVLVLSESTLSSLGSILLKLSKTEEIYNDPLSGVASLSVTNPSSTYAFASGLKGISVIDANDNLLDVGGGSYDYDPIDTGERYGPMAASSDGYIYMSDEGGDVSVITANPYVVISGVTYSGGGSSMGVGGSATITFQSDESGTYVVRVGGNVDGSGTLITDSSGQTTNSVTAATDTTFTFNYNDNASKLSEGADEVFVFVTDSVSDLGRDATTVTVDTPPPAVTVNSASFGNGRIYINANRLTVSDMNYYNFYVSTDPDAVINRTVTPTRVYQPSSGTTFTAEISGLTNGLDYYASVEGVDNAGNVGTLTYTFADGSRILSTPELTVGPVELSGEAGCSLGRGSHIMSFPRKRESSESGAAMFVVTAFLPLMIFIFWRGKRSIVVVLLFAALLFPAGGLFAQEYTSQWWTTEIKGGLWVPMGSVMKSFFSPCCHMTGAVSQGFLYDSKYGFEVGAGFLSETGSAKGSASGTKSGDRFNLFLLPVETTLAFRADFLEDQILVPYVKVGADYVFFRENLKGKVTSGMKYGLHTAGGLQILLDMIDAGGKATMEQEWGINDVYFTLEGRYSWVNDFGGGGLNLTSLSCIFGVLFEY